MLSMRILAKKPSSGDKRADGSRGWWPLSEARFTKARNRQSRERRPKRRAGAFSKRGASHLGRVCQGRHHGLRFPIHSFSAGWLAWPFTAETITLRLPRSPRGSEGGGFLWRAPRLRPWNSRRRWTANLLQWTAPNSFPTVKLRAGGSRNPGLRTPPRPGQPQLW
jgi:hypothetical protein